MENDCTVLIEKVEQQTACYQELLTLAAEKQKVLVKGDIPELEKITKVEEALILRVGRLEEERRKVHLALADRFALSPEELTISELANRADAQTGENCRRVFAEITGVLQELAEANDANARLIKSSLDFVDFSMNLLTDTESSGYGQKDDNRRQTAAKIFDRRI